MATSTPFTNATVAQRELEVLSVVFTRADEQDYDTELSDSCLSNGDLLKCALVNRAWCNEVMSVLGHLPYEPFNLILEDISGNGLSKKLRKTTNVRSGKSTKIQVESLMVHL